VPSNMARAVMNQIVRYGEVRRGRLGMRWRTSRLNWRKNSA